MPRRKLLSPTGQTLQVKEVQGPQRPLRPPKRGYVELESNLFQDYLGTGLVGLEASLSVLNNTGGDRLICKHGYELYRQMADDDEVDANFTTLLNGANAQPIHFTTPLQTYEDGYRVSKRYADFLNHVAEQFDMDEWVTEAMRKMLTFGNSASEATWEHFSTRTYGDRYVIKGFRLQQPEHYGYIVDRWGYVYGLAPLGRAAGTLFPLGNLIPLHEGELKILEGAIPTYKLSLWTWEKDGTDPRGTSILRSAYIPWWAKQKALEEWSCWIGRYGQPSIVAMPGPDAINQCDPHTKEIITPTQALLNILRNFKNASALALPYGSTLEILEANGGVEPFLASMDKFDRSISRAMLGQHLATGEGQNQSRSAAEVHALVLRQTINKLRYYKAKVLLRDFIKPVIRYNYGDIDPRLMPIVNLGDGDGTPPTVTDIAVLLQSGYFTQDQLVKLDRILGLPQRETQDPAGPQAISNMGKETELDTDKLAVSTRRSRPSSASGTTTSRVGASNESREA